MLNRDVNPIISIVVSVYGTEEYFDRCIKSLLNQSYKNLEIIVVNDGSKGNISELIKAYEDPRINYIDNKKNQGLLRARVCGSRAATGDYIAFVDSDDYVSFDFYRTLLSRATDSNADITIGKTVWVNGNEKYVYNYHESCFQFDVLKDEEIKKAFFEQEYQCYSWHTIWNKLYKKTLWDACFTAFEKVDSHIIMTEDIFFSSILFFNAHTVCHTYNDAYFYCVNDNASTNSKAITIERFGKNIDDITYVFDAVEKYMKSVGANQNVLHGIYNGRQHYARMWKNLAEHAFSDNDRATALAAVGQFCRKYGEQKVQDDYFFESVKTAWDGGLEFIKEKLRDGSQKYISFDVFDTLITRPFYDPKDLFLLMDSTFSRLSGNSISFSKLRRDAEELARRYYGMTTAVEDITLDEIYDFMVDHYGIKRSLAMQMKSLECVFEKKYCRARRTGVELLELAETLGKKVILISDMYLGRDVIEDILETCGVSGYEKLYVSSEEKCLKYNGHLFARALSDQKILPGDVIHIGDGWQSDIEGSKIAGISSIFLPKATEVFENKIHGCETNRCAAIGMDSCGLTLDYQKAKESLPYRCMQTIAANVYFDNPYRNFNADSDFNMDPYFIGFYPVGMHLAGLIKWIDSNVEKLNVENILFLARDGYLPMKAYEIYKRYTKCNRKKSIYIQASRKALMPVMVKDLLNFYQLPIEYRAHSPKTLCAVLAFLIVEEDEKNVSKMLKGGGFEENEPFKSLEEYHQFIEFFEKNLYSEEKHLAEKEKVRQYYQQLPDNSIAFDMGYSGRIQAALCEAAGKTINVLFLHEDYKTSGRMKEFAGFQTYTFYDFQPTISGLMREHIFSDCSGSCVGFEKAEGRVLPVLEKRGHSYPDRYVINTIQNAALSFLNRFFGEFGEQAVVMNYSPMEVSIPFEGFLRQPSKNDMHIFSASYFEDLVFGAHEDINIEEFAMQNLAALGWMPKTRAEKKMEVEQNNAHMISDEDQIIIDMINHNAQWKRAVIWLLMDWKFFKEKLRVNINRIFKR